MSGEFINAVVVSAVNLLMIVAMFGGVAAAMRSFTKRQKSKEEKNANAMPESPSPSAVAEQAAVVEEDSAAESESLSTPSETEQPADIFPKHIAAIMGAIHEFTSLPAGAFQIEKVQALGQMPFVRFAQGQPSHAHLAAIAMAINEYLDLPPEALQITGIQYLGPLGSAAMSQPWKATHAATWKMAGRFDLANRL